MQNDQFPQQQGSSSGSSLLPRLLYLVQCRNRYRPQDNNTEWWRTYCSEFFAANAIVRVSVKDMPVFHQPHTAIPQSLTCTEVPTEVLPRLFQFKYENGVQEELLFLGNVIESTLPDGGVSIICYQAAEHLVFDGYSLVQYGHLKVVFNMSNKVQLFDLSITGYDLHLNHNVVHSEMKQLFSSLDQRLAGLNALSCSGGAMDSRVLGDMLRQITEVVKMFSGRVDQYLSLEWSYIQKVLHFMQMADVISSMQLLFHDCGTSGASPLAILQRYGRTSAPLAPWSGTGGTTSATAASCPPNWPVAATAGVKRDFNTAVGGGGGPVSLPSGDMTIQWSAMQKQMLQQQQQLLQQTMTAAGAGASAGSPMYVPQQQSQQQQQQPSPQVHSDLHKMRLQNAQQMQQQQQMGQLVSAMGFKHPSLNSPSNESLAAALQQQQLQQQLQQQQQQQQQQQPQQAQQHSQHPQQQQQQSSQHQHQTSFPFQSTLSNLFPDVPGGSGSSLQQQQQLQQLQQHQQQLLQQQQNLRQLSQQQQMREQQLGGGGGARAGGGGGGGPPTSAPLPFPMQQFKGDGLSALPPALMAGNGTDGLMMNCAASPQITQCSSPWPGGGPPSQGLQQVGAGMGQQRQMGLMHGLHGMSPLVGHMNSGAPGGNDNGHISNNNNGGGGGGGGGGGAEGPMRPSSRLSGQDLRQQPQGRHEDG